MLENLIFLTLIVSLTFTAKNYSMGVLVSCYYALYICIDLSYWGYIDSIVIDSFDYSARWYLICMALTIIIFIASLTLFVGGNNVAGLYAVWLFITLTLDGVSSIFQLAETNSLLMMYNKVQNISVYVDLFVVFIGMDHIIKRNYSGPRIFIEYINNTLECWRSMVLLLLNTGAKCRKKKYLN